MTQTTLDLDAFINTIRELAEANPRSRYWRPENGFGCMYAGGHSTDGGCGCIMGQGLAIHGIDPAQFDRDPQTGGTGGEVYNIEQVLETFGYKDTDLRVIWCSYFQVSQDHDMRWGKCLEETDAEIKLPMR